MWNHCLKQACCSHRRWRGPISSHGFPGEDKAHWGQDNWPRELEELLYGGGSGYSAGHLKGSELQRKNFDA